MDVIIMILTGLAIFAAIAAGVFTYLDNRTKHQRWPHSSVVLFLWLNWTDLSRTPHGSTTQSSALTQG